MKRYLAFYGDIYYPSGGMDDFIGDFDTLDEAIDALNKKRIEWRPDDDGWINCWGQVWDCEKRDTVVVR